MCATYDGGGMARKPSKESLAFGALLKAARDAAGLTTEQLARELIFTRETVDRHMRGERRPTREVVERWEKLCRAEPGSLVRAYDALPSTRRPRPDEPEIEPELPPIPVPPKREESPRPGPRRRGLLRVVGGAAAFVLVLAGAGYVAGSVGGDRGTNASSQPDPSYAEGLRTVMVRVDRVRLEARRKLKSTRKPKEQASAAKRVGAAFTTAIREVRRLPTTSREAPATGRLRDYLIRARNGYLAMVTAVGDEDKAAFASAGERVERAERDLQTALRSLRTVGYLPVSTPG